MCADYYWGGAKSRRSGASTLWIIAGEYRQSQILFHIASLLILLILFAGLVLLW